jgi:hypothetical protein
MALVQKQPKQVDPKLVKQGRTFLPEEPLPELDVTALSPLDPELVDDSDDNPTDEFGDLRRLFEHVLHPRVGKALVDEVNRQGSSAWAADALSALRGLTGDVDTSGIDAAKAMLSEALQGPQLPNEAEVTLHTQELAEQMAVEWVEFLDLELDDRPKLHLERDLLPPLATGDRDLRRRLAASLATFVIHDEEAPAIMTEVGLALFARTKRVTLPGGLALERDSTGFLLTRPV